MLPVTDPVVPEFVNRLQRIDTYAEIEEIMMSPDFEMARCRANDIPGRHAHHVRGRRHATAKEIREAGQTAIAVTLDVGRKPDIDAAVSASIAHFGRLDVLINAAATVAPAMLKEADLDVWDAAFGVNVRGALKLALACLPHLRKSPSPAIVHVGSLAGVAGYARSGSYGPSNAALMTLGRQMALEWAIDGIRVNVVLPGTIDTPAVCYLSDEAIATRKNQIPFGRLSHASEQADMALFLASPVASFITGQCFVVDGGFSLNIYPQPMGMQETLREQAEKLAIRALPGTSRPYNGRRSRS